MRLTPGLPSNIIRLGHYALLVTKNSFETKKKSFFKIATWGAPDTDDGREDDHEPDVEASLFLMQDKNNNHNKLVRLSSQFFYN